MPSALSPSPTLLSNRRTGAILLGGVLSTIVVFLLPAHGFIGRPLLWLSTLCHELGHGITAWLVGGRFESFIMTTKGGGLARAYGASDTAEALICAGGLVGPAIVAAIGFALARRARVAQVSLLVGAALLLTLAILVAGNWLAWAFMPGVALALIWVAARKNPEPAQVALVFVSTQLALSVFSRGDYLFTRSATVAGDTSPSDVELIARAVGGPYWLWGLCCGALSILALVMGLWLFARAYPDVGLDRLRSLRKR